jgi:hypothetical protein
VRWQKPGIAVIGVGVGALATVLLTAAVGPEPRRTPRDARDLITLDQAPSWRHDADRMTVSGLKISAEHDGLTRRMPGASVTITNSSDDAQIVAVFVTLLDTDLKQVACCCLKAEGMGIVQAGTKVTPVAMLAVPSGDIARVRYAAVRVTRAKVMRLPEGTSA